MQQNQQHHAELRQLRSAAENGNTALVAEIRQLGQWTGIQSRQDTEAGRIVGVTESFSSEYNTLPDVESAQIDASERENNVLTKRKSKRRERKYQYSINLAWLTGKVWKIAAARAENGWDFGMRSWSLRSIDSPIFLACDEGDLSTVRKLLQSGQASIYDFVFDGSEVKPVLLVYSQILADQLAVLFSSSCNIALVQLLSDIC
jgi:hypothetical protein